MARYLSYLLDHSRGLFLQVIVFAAYLVELSIQDTNLIFQLASLSIDHSDLGFLGG